MLLSIAYNTHYSREAMMEPKQPAQRSDNLLPAEDEVAEEVSLDQQSGQARRVGHPPVIPTPPGGKPAAETDEEGAPHPPLSPNSPP